MELESLRDLYIDELKDLYSAEKQLVRALPKMAKNATNAELKEAFENHLEETEGHVSRLEQIFEMLEENPRGKKCVGMEGLIEEANELLEEDAEDDVVDAGLISKAQHVEHYEMAGYGTVRAWAELLGESAQVELLQQTLDEEENADRLLTELATSSVNLEAATGDDGEEEEEAEATRSTATRGGAKRASATRGGAKRASATRGGSKRASAKRPNAKKRT